MSLDAHHEGGPLPDLFDPFARSRWNIPGRLKDWATQKLRTILTENWKGIPADVQTELSEGELAVITRRLQSNIADYVEGYARQNGGRYPPADLMESVRGNALLNLMTKYGIDPMGSAGLFLFRKLGAQEFGVRHRNGSTEAAPEH